MIVLAKNDELHIFGKLKDLETFVQNDQEPNFDSKVTHSEGTIKTSITTAYLTISVVYVNLMKQRVEKKSKIFLFFEALPWR